MSHNEARDQRRGGRGTVEARRRRRMQPTVLALEPRNLLSTNWMPFHPHLPTAVPPAGSTINIASTTAGTIAVTQGNGNGDSVSINSNAGKIIVDVGDGNDDSVSITSDANIVVKMGKGTGDSVTIDETGDGTVTVTTGSGQGTVSITTTGPPPTLNLGGTWTQI
jgi:hypothetical protein